MTTTPDDPFELDIKATAELDGQGDPALPPGVIAGFFAGGAADRDAEIADARGMTYRKPAGHTRVAPLLGIRDESVAPEPDGGDHMPDPFLDHPDAVLPFGGGPLPDCVTEPEPGVYLLEMPDPGPEAEPF